MADHRAIDYYYTYNCNLSDCVVILGCKGEERLRLRCDGALNLPETIKKRAALIGSGWHGEANHIVQYIKSKDKDSFSVVIEDNLARNTISNVVFSYYICEKRGYEKPLFVSEWSHIWRIESLAYHFGNGKIKPEFLKLRSNSEQLKALKDDIDRIAEDPDSGIGHVFRFMQEVAPLDYRQACQWLCEYDSRFSGLDASRLYDDLGAQGERLSSKSVAVSA